MTVYTFTVVRPNSLDPLEVISDATPSGPGREPGKGDGEPG